MTACNEVFAIFVGRLRSVKPVCRPADVGELVLAVEAQPTRPPSPTAWRQPQE